MKEETYQFGTNNLICVTHDEIGAIKYIKNYIVHPDEEYVVISEYGYYNYLDAFGNTKLNIKEKYVTKSLDENDETGVIRYYSTANSNLPYEVEIYQNGIKIRDKKHLKIDPDEYVVSDFIKDMLSMNVENIRRIAYKKIPDKKIGPNILLPLDTKPETVYKRFEPLSGTIYQDPNKELKKVHKM